MKGKVIVFAMVVAFGLIGSAAAQQVSRINVPFGFEVNGRAMPAGEYRVWNYNDHRLVLQGRTNKATAVAFYTLIGQRADRRVLVFEKVASTYVLSGATVDGERVELVLDKAAKRKLAGTTQAVVAAQGD